MPDPFMNVRSYLPRAEARKLLTILQQIPGWKDTDDAQASRSTTQERPTPAQRPPQA